MRGFDNNQNAMYSYLSPEERVPAARSKTLDNVSGSLSTDELNATRAGQNGGNIYNDQSNPQQNKARGDFDRPQRLVVSYSYDIPVAKNSFMNNQVFKGWTISGITTYQKGLPFSVPGPG